MMAMRWGAAGLVVLGMLATGGAVWSMSSELDLVEVGLESTITSTFRGKNPAGMFRDRSGESHPCRGSFEVGEVVVYDPASPWRCRPVWAVGGFDSQERLWLTVGGVLVLLGIVTFAFEYFMASDDDLEKALRGELPAPAPDARPRDARAHAPEEEQRW